MSDLTQSPAETKLLYILHITHTNLEENRYPKDPWNSVHDFVFSSYDKEQAIAEAIKTAEFLADHSNRQLDKEDEDLIRSYQEDGEEDSEES